MGRKPRIEYYGAIYHVIQRGNNREYIFRDEQYKSYLLKITREFKTIMDFELYGYVLMDNHYHMIIKTLDIPLSTIMHRINNRYSKFYNDVERKTGHVFENRYKGVLVKDDKYLLSLLRYIHQNPIKAKMCKSVKDYDWSSDLLYRSNINKGLVDIDFILDIFSKDRIKALDAYAKFMNDEELEKSCEFEDVQYIGEDEENEEEKLNKELKLMDRSKLLDNMLYEISQEIHIYEAIKSGSRKRNLTKYKKQYIEKALSENYTMKQIGEKMSVSEVAIFNMHNRK